jgi:hypothetical protein
LDVRERRRVTGQAAHLFGRERHVTRPISPKVGTGDFALAAGHRLTAVRRLLDTPNSAAAFSMAVASSDASTVPSQTAGAAIFQMLYLVGFGGSGFLAMRQVSAAEYY